jgi:phthiodiolone/phenolphthiodiolone dimycocerosates ketoreductase
MNDNRATVRVGLALIGQPPVSALRQALWISRAVGLERIMVWDHLQNFLPQRLWTSDLSWQAAETPHAHAFYDFQVLLGNLAASAGRMQLGVGVTEAVRRHPMVIAQALLTLSHLTRKPPILGISAGELMNIEPYGLDFSRPVSRLEEALQVIRLAFSSNGPFNFTGEFFRLTDAHMDLQPARGQVPPIWIAAHGPRMLRLTGRYGDGWYPGHTLGPQDYAEKLSVVREAAIEAGRDPDGITPGLEAKIVIAPTDEEAWQLARSHLIRLLALLHDPHIWESVGAQHPLDDYPGHNRYLPERLDTDALHEAAASVPDEVIAELFWIGSPETLACKFRAIGKAGLRYVSILPLSAAVSKRNLRYLPRGLWRLRRLLA